MYAQKKKAIESKNGTVTERGKRSTIQRKIIRRNGDEIKKEGLTEAMNEPNWGTRTEGAQKINDIEVDIIKKKFKDDIEGENDVIFAEFYNNVMTYLAIQKSEVEPVIFMMIQFAQLLEAGFRNELIDVAKKTEGQVMLGPIKKDNRVMDKVEGKVAESDLSEGWVQQMKSVKDVLRATIVYNKWAELQIGSKALLKLFEFKNYPLIKNDNIFSNPKQNTGYRDAKIVYGKKPDGDMRKKVEEALDNSGKSYLTETDDFKNIMDSGIPVELQINLKENISVKEGEQKKYEGEAKDGKTKNYITNITLEGGKEEHWFKIDKYLTEQFPENTLKNDGTESGLAAYAKYKNITTVQLPKYRLECPEEARNPLALPNDHDIYQRKQERQETESDTMASEIYKELYDLVFFSAGGPTDTKKATIEGFENK